MFTKGRHCRKKAEDLQQTIDRLNGRITELLGRGTMDQETAVGLRSQLGGYRLNLSEHLTEYRAARDLEVYMRNLQDVEIDLMDIETNIHSSSENYVQQRERERLELAEQANERRYQVPDDEPYDSVQHPSTTHRLPPATNTFSSSTRQHPSATHVYPSNTRQQHSSATPTMPAPASILPPPTPPTRTIPAPRRTPPPPTSTFPPPTSNLPALTLTIPVPTSILPPPTRPTRTFPAPRRTLPPPTSTFRPPTSNLPAPTSILPPPTRTLPTPTNILLLPTNFITCLKACIPNLPTRQDTVSIVFALARAMNLLRTA